MKRHVRLTVIVAEQVSYAAHLAGFILGITLGTFVLGVCVQPLIDGTFPHICVGVL